MAGIWSAPKRCKTSEYETAKADKRQSLDNSVHTTRGWENVSPRDLAIKDYFDAFIPLVPVSKARDCLNERNEGENSFVAPRSQLSQRG